MSVVEHSKSRLRRWLPANRGPSLALGAAVIVALVGLAVWVGGGDTETTSSRTPLEAVERHIDLRLSGDLEAALGTLTPEAADEERDFYQALAVWNLRGEQVAPCEEVRPQSVRCVVSEFNDFLAPGGLSPWTNTITFEVDDNLMITSVEPWVSTYVDIATYSSAFRRWMEANHPEEQALVQGSLPDGTIDASDARIALRYVDEFVAQSERYPLDD